jgi:spore coat protein U-like protein
MAVAQSGPGSSCRIIATGVNFGDYSALDSFPNLSIGRVIVDCRGAPDFPTRVTVNTGGSGTPFRRVMRLGNQELEYNLFVDPGRRRVAGDGSGGTLPLLPRLRTPDRNIFLIFGAIRPRQPVMAGDYTDRIRVDLEF